MSDSSWSWAVDLTARFLKKPARLPHLLERLPPSMDSGARRRCQLLLSGVVRNWSFLDSVLDGFMRKRPRVGLRAALLVTACELMVSPEKASQIVDHAVGQIGKRYSRVEKGLANAVLRKVATELPKRLAETPKDLESVACRWSHPQWLVERWAKRFSGKSAFSLAQWNQAEPELYALPLTVAGEALGVGSQWPPYRNLSGLLWEEIQSSLDRGEIYIQNPAARLAPDLLKGVFTGGRILDLCAAPGGKGICLDRVLGDELREWVAVDLPGPRLERLRANLQRFASPRSRVIGSDLFDLDLDKLGLFEAVLLDAPCSNTGVMQRKPDVKWRLRPEDFAELIALQSRMLTRAANFVAPGGGLIYSTCSIDPEENRGRVEAFLGAPEGEAFRLQESSLSLPWESGCDGAGAFALIREG